MNTAGIYVLTALTYFHSYAGVQPSAHTFSGEYVSAEAAEHDLVGRLYTYAGQRRRAVQGAEISRLSDEGGRYVNDNKKVIV